MSFSDILVRLDRRVIFLAIMLVVLVPYVHPIGLPIRVSRESEAFFAAIEQVPEGSTVLLAADFDPGSMPELLPMTQAALEQCFRRNLKVVGMCLWPAGPPLLDRAFAVVAPKYDKVYGKDYVNLGFKQGQEAVMVRVGASIPETFPADYAGRPVGQFEVMRGVQNLSSVNILINISAGYPGTKEWVQQVGQRFPNALGQPMPIVSGCTAVSAPEYYAYVSTGQLKGLLGGLAGAAEYEDLVHVKGTATRGMDGQSLAHLAIIFFILLGNGLQHFTRRGSHAA
jgi:hypothetical protein